MQLNRYWLVATLVGSLPAALVYAMAGAAGARSGTAIMVFAGVLLLAGAFWVLSRQLIPGSKPERPA